MSLIVDSKDNDYLPRVFTKTASLRRNEITPNMIAESLEASLSLRQLRPREVKRLFLPEGFAFNPKIINSRNKWNLH